jgi:DHA1 family tetracycline resistance protein-like MFS transporter
MKRPLAFLLATVFLDMLGLGLIVPIGPALVTALTGHASSAALWSGLIQSSYGILQFLSAPLLGRAADRYGRRPVLVASVTLLGIDFLIHSIASHAWQLLAAHALAGLFAGNQIAVSAYIADVAAPAQRARAFGLVGAAVAIGFIAGPAIGGPLGAVNVRLPFLVAGGLALVNAAYGWLILPESRPGDRRTALSLRVANPFSSVTALLRRPDLGRLALARMFRDIARVIDQETWVFFMMIRFGWSTAHIGITMAASAALSGLVGAKLTGPVIERYGPRRVALLAIGLDAATFTAYAFLPSGTYAYPLIITGVLAGLAGAALSTLIANATDAGEQGTVQGALGGISALTGTVLPVLATALFAVTIHTGWPGAVFAVAAAMLVVSGTALRASPPAGDRHPLATTHPVT